MHITNIIRLVWVICGMILIGSCNEPDAFKGWDKDYEDYQLGAYINGIEYHESRSFFHPVDIGFYMMQRDSLLLIRPAADLHFKCQKDEYFCDIMIIVNNSTYKAGETYSFNRTVWEYDYFNEFRRGKYEIFGNLPFVIAAITKSPPYENVSFVSTDGEIILGAFDKDGHNSDVIRFSLKAEDENGNSLKVEGGYCKKYHRR